VRTGLRSGEGLSETGYVEAERCNRISLGNDRLPEMAADLVRRWVGNSYMLLCGA
jgi:hypothetical protein